MPASSLSTNLVAAVEPPARVYHPRLDRELIDAGRRHSHQPVVERLRGLEN